MVSLVIPISHAIDLRDGVSNIKSTRITPLHSRISNKLAWVNGTDVIILGEIHSNRVACHLFQMACSESRGVEAYIIKSRSPPVVD